jgi:hypothetical protein
VVVRSTRISIGTRFVTAAARMRVEGRLEREDENLMQTEVLAAGLRCSRGDPCIFQGITWRNACP